jgi:hypothetical protein
MSTPYLAPFAVVSGACHSRLIHLRHSAQLISRMGYWPIRHIRSTQSAMARCVVSAPFSLVCCSIRICRYCTVWSTVLAPSFSLSLQYSVLRRLSAFCRWCCLMGLLALLGLPFLLSPNAIDQSSLSSVCLSVCLSGCLPMPSHPPTLGASLPFSMLLLLLQSPGALLCVLEVLSYKDG